MMTLLWIALTGLSAWIGGAIVEGVLAYRWHRHLERAAADGRQLCGVCTIDLTNLGAARHAGRIWEVDYLAGLALRWPIYRTWQALEALHLAQATSIHNGPCERDQTTEPATT